MTDDTVELREAFMHRLAGVDLASHLPERLRELFDSGIEALDSTALHMKDYFDPAESAYICDALRNADYPLERFEEWPKMLSWDLEDVEKCEKLGSRRYGVDMVELLDKAEYLTHEQALWLLAAVDRFWEERTRRGDQEDFFEVHL